MSERALCDIIPGSVWDGDYQPAHVLNVADNYVRFRQGREAVEVAHHLQFRRRFLAPYDARQVRSQFAMTVANMQEFHAFWSFALKRLFTRSVNRQPEHCYTAARGSPALPPDCCLIGTYADPVNADAFFEDLHFVLHQARQERAA